MIQKKSLFIPAIILLFSFVFFLAPSSIDAADSNVNDWIKEKQTDGKTGVEEEESIELNTSGEKSFGVIIGQLVLYTLIILGMIYGLIKFLAARQKNLQPNQAVKLMGGTPLGNNKSLQLVKVGEQLLLIGVGDHVTLIKEFSATDEINGIEKTLEQQPAQLSNSISNFIKNKVSNRVKNPKEHHTNFEHLFSQSLDKQKARQNQLKHDLSNEDDEEGRSK